MICYGESEIKRAKEILLMVEEKVKYLTNINDQDTRIKLIAEINQHIHIIKTLVKL